MPSQSVPNSRGGYRFLLGIDPYSSGVVAEPGYEIVHATLARPVAWEQGLNAVRRYLEGIERPRHALCGVELRCPEPFSFEGFAAFNRRYHAVLAEWDLLVDGQNPVARTNVSPVASPPDESVLYGFSYTVPQADARPSFVVAGGGELREGGLNASQIVRCGETSPDALLDKAAHVVDIMRRRLMGLGVETARLSAINIYSAHPIDAIVPQIIVPALPQGALIGIHWVYSRPPVAQIEFEMDLRGVGHEKVVDLHS
ncbi:MAG: hypothetical protein KF861_18855 [Planctomycetaceae bacterium]|nr:hypothetical protein [Planctomycetaceae bacterium]